MDQDRKLNIFKVNCLKSNDFIFIPNEYIEKSMMIKDMCEDNSLDNFTEIDIPFASNELLDFYELYKTILFTYTYNDNDDINPPTIVLQNFLNIASYLGLLLPQTIDYFLHNSLSLMSNDIYKKAVDSFLIPLSIKLDTIEYYKLMYDEFIIMADTDQDLDQAFLKRYKTWLDEGKITKENYDNLIRLTKIENENGYLSSYNKNPIEIILFKNANDRKNNSRKNKLNLQLDPQLEEIIKSTTDIGDQINKLIEKTENCFKE